MPAVMAPDGDVFGHDRDSGKAESTVSNGKAHSMCVLSSATLDGGAPAVVTLDGSALSTCLLALAAAFDGALCTYLSLISGFDFSTFLASYYFPLAVCGWPSVDDTSDESSDDGDDEWLDVHGNSLTGAEASSLVLTLVTYDGFQWLWHNGSALTPEEVLFLANVLGMESILPAE